MKTTSTINRIATIVGLSLGAFALSVAAQSIPLLLHTTSVIHCRQNMVLSRWVLILHIQ